MASVTFLMGLNRNAVGIPIPPSSFEDFENAAANNDLPKFSFVSASTSELHAISPLLGPAEDDDHPASDVRDGETFMYKVVHALMRNPTTFQKTILFITFDKNGGLYDHVVPPPACSPGGDPPEEPVSADAGVDAGADAGARRKRSRRQRARLNVTTMTSIATGFGCR